jgi:peroxiredoxin
MQPGKHERRRGEPCATALPGVRQAGGSSSGSAGKRFQVLVVLVVVLSPLAGFAATLAELLTAFDLAPYTRNMKAPVFSATTTTEQPVSLTALQGKVVLLNFWATWCAECRPELRGLEQVHHALASRGLAVLGVNAGEDFKVVQRYARNLGVTFPLILDPQQTMSRLYGVAGMPTTFLLGRDGRTVALAVGAREWQSPAARPILDVLLAEPASPQEGR